MCDKMKEFSKDSRLTIKHFVALGMLDTFMFGYDLSKAVGFRDKKLCIFSLRL